MIWTRVLLALACWVLLLPLLATSAQDAPRTGEPAAQTVAHGVMAMPADVMVWQSELQRAVVSPRAEAMPQPGGFVLADTGSLAITDAAGKPLQRLAPGEATWIDPGDIRAIISLEGRSAGYLRISLIPASFVPDEPGAASHGDPFAAPTGVADLDLLRDILPRGEELVVVSGDTPALLQVTSGKVYVTGDGGEIGEVSAGSPLQFQGQLTLSGGSRAPAALVIARLGPPVPARLELRDPNATPVATPWATPLATPLSLTDEAALSVEAWLCPPGYDASAPIISCTGPAAGVRFTAEGEDESVNILADSGGTAAFPPLKPGNVTLRANLPEGARTAVATCRDLRGDALGRVRDSALSLSLAPGASVGCSWFTEVGATWPAASLTVSVLACPPGMTAKALHPEYCLPPETQVAPQLAVADAVLEPAQAGEDTWVWGPLLERTYDLTLLKLDDRFSGAVLDDGTMIRNGEAFPIHLGENPAAVRTVYLLQSPDANAAEVDSDADRLTDAQELEIETDPFLADTDGDGLADGDETDVYGTEPQLADTDDDGLDDQEEVAVVFTNPFLADTDGDGVGDADEVTAQTNPLDMLSLPPTATPEPTATPQPTATPLPTATPSPTPTLTPTPLSSPVAPAATPTWSSAATPVGAATRIPAALPTLAPEASPISHKATPASTPDSTAAAAALDNDGLTTLDEVAIYGTNPLVADTDGDGTNDGDEVASGRDPRDPAS
ncbi:MAG: hypothetical protein JNM64_12110 [Chloroflexia bacterium]|nr:hypothetical protein [Chloroflexia bacterium]